MSPQFYQSHKSIRGYFLSLSLNRKSKIDNKLNATNFINLLRECGKRALHRQFFLYLYRYWIVMISNSELPHTQFCHRNFIIFILFCENKNIKNSLLSMWLLSSAMFNNNSCLCYVIWCIIKTLINGAENGVCVDCRVCPTALFVSLCCVIEVWRWPIHNNDLIIKFNKNDCRANARCVAFRFSMHLHFTA